VVRLQRRDEGLVAAGDPDGVFLYEASDVTIRTPLALHRGSPNRTNKPRPMVVMGYVMHWLHTKVDLTLQRDYYESLPAQVQLLRCQVVDQLPKEKPKLT